MDTTALQCVLGVMHLVYGILEPHHHSTTTSFNVSVTAVKRLPTSRPPCHFSLVLEMKKRVSFWHSRKSSKSTICSVHGLRDICLFNCLLCIYVLQQLLLIWKVMDDKFENIVVKCVILDILIRHTAFLGCMVHQVICEIKRLPDRGSIFHILNVISHELSYAI